MLCLPVVRLVHAFVTVVCDCALHSAGRDSIFTRMLIFCLGTCVPFASSCNLFSTTSCFLVVALVSLCSCRLFFISKAPSKKGVKSQTQNAWCEMAFIHSIFDHIFLSLALSRFFLNQIFVYRLCLLIFFFVSVLAETHQMYFVYFWCCCYFDWSFFFNSFSYSITFTLALWARCSFFLYLVCTQLFDRSPSKKCLGYLAFSITHFWISHWNNYIVFRRQGR